MRPDFNIYFLTLPIDTDPDSYINENAKESFSLALEMDPNYIPSYINRSILFLIENNYNEDTK